MSEMDILFPVPDGRRNADDMGNPPDPTAAPAQGEPQDYDALIERLRDVLRNWTNVTDEEQSVIRDAADAIAALRAEVARLDTRNRELCYGWSSQNERAERAEAEARESNERAHTETERRMRAEAERDALQQKFTHEQEATYQMVESCKRAEAECEKLRAALGMESAKAISALDAAREGK